MKIPLSTSPQNVQSSVQKNNGFNKSVLKPPPGCQQILNSHFGYTSCSEGDITSSDQMSSSALCFQIAHRMKKKLKESAVTTLFNNSSPDTFV